MTSKGSSNPITRSSLGRQAFLGELYNIRNESLSSRSLFKNSLPAEYIQKRKTSRTELEYKFIENLSDRFDFLSVDGDLQVSVLCGLVDVNGSGKFLKEDKKSRKAISCSLICKFETVSEKIFGSFDEMVEHIDFTALSDPEYTHLVFEISWGANALLSLEATHSSEDEKRTLQGKFNALLSSFSVLLNGEAEANLSKNQGFSDLKCETTVKVCADVVSDKGLPTDIDGFQELVKSIPVLLEKMNDGKGKPLNYVLIPLSGLRKAARLESIGEVIVKTIDESFLLSIMCLFDEISLLKQSLNDVLQEIMSLKKLIKDEDIKEARNQVESLKRKESDLKLIISEDWVLVKSGDKSLKDLVRRVEKFKSRDLCLYAYEEYIDSCAAVRSKIAALRKYESAGIILVGKGEKFADVLSADVSSEYIVMVTSSELENNDPVLHQNVSYYLATLVADKAKNTKYAYVDLDFALDGTTKATFLGESLSETRCFHLIGNKIASSDLYGNYVLEQESNFARLSGSNVYEVTCRKPGNRVFLEMECPGSSVCFCSSEKLTWTCFHCKLPIEYGFDEYFYCSCGRGEATKYEFRCSDLKHGPVYISSHPRLFDELSLLRPFKELNILILGQSGVGKSTWINSIVNYLNYETLQRAKEGGVLCKIPTKINAYDSKTKTQHVIKIGLECENEDTETGRSATQASQTYSFLWGDRYVRLIDTPGLGDTRGIEQDKLNMKNIVEHIGHLRELHGVCILMKANENRINAVFSYCLKELLIHLHKSVAGNIVFCFTNARNSFYTPGQTSALLEELVDKFDLRKELSLGYHNMFCLDNEAFLFLCTLTHPEINYEDHLVTSFEKSWEISLIETKRLFETIRDFKPHFLKETLSLVTARSRILSLTKPIAEISKTIQLNLAAINFKKQEIDSSDQTLADLAKKLKVTEIHLEPVTLNRPRTVCTSPKCVRYLKYTDMDVTEIEYVTHCHTECYLKNVVPKTVNNHELQHCDAMKNGICKVCGCSWQNHMHLTFSQKRVEKEATNKKVANDMEKEKSAKEAIEKFVEELEIKTEKYKAEQDIIIQTSVKFGMFLKENAISVYNDSVAEYLKYLIQEEENKPYKSEAEEKLLKVLKETLNHYNAEVKILQEVMNKTGDLTEPISIHEVLRLEEQLYTLELTGEDIKKNVEANRSSNQNAYRYSETPLNISNVNKKKKRNALSKVKNFFF